MDILEKLKGQIAIKKEILFKIKAFPNSRENSLKKGKEVLMNVKITDVPEDGKANKAIIKLIASGLKLRKYQVEIVAGLKERIKTIKISR